MDQSRIRITLAVFSAVTFALILYFVDYSDMSWSNNKSVYLTLILYGFLATAMVGHFFHDQSQPKDKEDPFLSSENKD